MSGEASVAQEQILANRETSPKTLEKIRFGRRNEMAAQVPRIDDLYSAHRDWMLRRATARLRDAVAAEDAVQETFAIALERVDFSSVDNTRGYLARMLDNIITARHRKFGKETPNDDLPEQLEEVDLGEQLHASERRQILLGTLASLNRRQRRVLMLHSEGLTRNDIAAHLGIAPGSAAVLLHRAKANLKREALKRGLLPTIVPGVWWRFRLRIRSVLESWARNAQAMEIVLIQVGMLVMIGVIPGSEDSHHPADYRSGASSNNNVSERSVIEPVADVHDPSRLSPTSPTKSDGSGTRFQSVGKYLHISEWYTEDGPDPEPSITDQIEEIIGDPSSILPECQGNLPCPPS